MTYGYNLPDKFYDKMTFEQQLRYLRKHKILLPVHTKRRKVRKLDRRKTKS